MRESVNATIPPRWSGRSLVEPVAVRRIRERHIREECSRTTAGALRADNDPQALLAAYFHAVPELAGMWGPDINEGDTKKDEP